MKIVKFENGKYGIRRLGFFGYEYKDLDDKRFWWSAGKWVSSYQKDKKTVQGYFDAATDKGVPVND